MTISVGDTVIRNLGGVKMYATVMYIEDGLIYIACLGAENWPKEELWRFELETLIEYDPDLQWGSEWGRTGSHLEVLIHGTPH